MWLRTSRRSRVSCNQCVCKPPTWIDAGKVTDLGPRVLLPHWIERSSRCIQSGREVFPDIKKMSLAWCILKIPLSHGAPPIPSRFASEPNFCSSTSITGPPKYFTLSAITYESPESLPGVSEGGAPDKSPCCHPLGGLPPDRGSAGDSVHSEDEFVHCELSERIQTKFVSWNPDR